MVVMRNVHVQRSKVEEMKEEIRLLKEEVREMKREQTEARSLLVQVIDRPIINAPPGIPPVMIPYDTIETIDREISQNAMKKNSDNLPIAANLIRNTSIMGGNDKILLESALEKFDNLENRFNFMEKKVQQFDSEIGELFERVEETNQYLRRNSLLWLDLKDIPKDRSERNMIGYMCWKINSTMPRKFQLNPSHIETAHLITPRNRNNRRPIVIVKFALRWIRNEVWWNRKYAFDRSYTITEHLTENRLSLYKKCKSTFGYENVYTEQCVVYIKKGTRSFRIRQKSDINKYE